MRAIAASLPLIALVASLGTAQDPAPDSRPSAPTTPALGSDPLVIVIESNGPNRRSVTWGVRDSRYGDSTALRLGLIELAQDPASLRTNPEEPQGPTVLMQVVIASCDHVTYSDVAATLRAAEDAGFAKEHLEFASSRIGHTFRWRLTSGETLTQRYTTLPGDWSKVAEVRAVPLEAEDQEPSRPTASRANTRPNPLSVRLRVSQTEDEKPVVSWQLEASEPVDWKGFAKQLQAVTSAETPSARPRQVVVQADPATPQDQVQLTLDRLFRLEFEAIQLTRPTTGR